MVRSSPNRRTVVTVGEGLLRLTPPDAAPVIGARTLEVHVGGALLHEVAGAGDGRASRATSIHVMNDYHSRRG